MEGYKIIGTLGACILVAGVFVPARFTKMVGYISYYSDYRNALILIALAVIAVVLVFSGSPMRLMTFGVLTLAVVTWTYMRRTPGIQAVENSMSQLAFQATSLTIVRNVSDSIVSNTPMVAYAGRRRAACHCGAHAVQARLSCVVAASIF